jgi:DnaJ-class molecular chaperone
MEEQQVVCPACDGYGYLFEEIDNIGTGTIRVTCPECHGARTIPEVTCPIPTTKY